MHIKVRKFVYTDSSQDSLVVWRHVFVFISINATVVLGTTPTVQWFYTTNTTREIFFNDSEITGGQNQIRPTIS